MNYMNCICQVSFSEPTLTKVAELRAAVLELLGKTKPGTPLGTPLGTLGTPVRSIDLSTWTAAAWNLQETHGHTSDTSWLRDVQSFNLAAVVRVRSNSSAACSAACFWMFLYLRANNGPMYESCMNHDSSWLRSYCYDFHLLGGFPLSTQRTSWVSTGLDLGSDSQPFSIKRSGLWLVACGLWPGWWSCGMRNLWCAHVQVSLQPWHHRRKAGPLMYRGVLGRGFLCRACAVWSEALWHSGAAAEASWELCSTVQGLSDCVSQLFKLSKLWMKSADLTSDWQFSYSGWLFERMFVGSQQASLWPLPFRGSRHCRVASLCS